MLHKLNKAFVEIKPVRKLESNRCQKEQHIDTLILPRKCPASTGAINDSHFISEYRASPFFLYFIFCQALFSQSPLQDVCNVFDALVPPLKWRASNLFFVKECRIPVTQ